MEYNICVSITSTNFNGCFPAVECCNMVELRLDLMQIDEAEINQLLGRGIPAVVTCREGVYDQARRQQLLLFAIDNGATYVDVEVEADEESRKTIVE
ncbi:MAG: type I 3-dehydroquinate dehydratase, partial [Prevotellaceae bacterium]|nr:type I 3-dehydroquinate dehydratase [Prevotellaceae bacterium]